MGEIIPSESVSNVTYTGINSMHSQKIKQSCGVLERTEPERRKARPQNIRANFSEDNPSRKELGGKERERVALRRKEPYSPKQSRTEQHRARTERIVATENKREERKRSNAKDP